MAQRISRLDGYLVGWVACFALAETPSAFAELEGWLRQRLRQCRWKEWKWGHTRKRNLLRLGLDERPRASGVLAQRIVADGWQSHPLPGPRSRYWQAEGLVSLSERYALFRHA